MNNYLKKYNEWLTDDCFDKETKNELESCLLYTSDAADE